MCVNLPLHCETPLRPTQFAKYSPDTQRRLSDSCSGFLTQGHKQYTQKLSLP